MTDFSKIKKVHFIGIGGIGISAIARMMRLEGKTVTGSDRSASHVTEELEKAGIKVMIGQKADNISPDTDLVIYTIAIPDDNPELVRAKKLGLACLTYPQALGQISKDKFTIAVSGTHGKTTTTAMIAKILIDAGLDPTVIVGSFLLDGKRNRSGIDQGIQTNFIAGKSKYLVAEACEYRRSFLNLHPSILVITNIDDDHLDYYKDLDDIESAFSELAGQIKSGGSLVCDLELPHVDNVARKSASAGVSVVDFDLFGDQNLKLKIPGQHNLDNAAAALAVADLLGIHRAVALESLRNFHGTWRRFEYRGQTPKGAIVYDDYGHHPTEVKATLGGAREMFPDRKIFVVFQPHLYSRTRQHLKGFGTVFGDVDDVTIAPIYPAREPFDSSISSAMVAAEIEKNSGLSGRASTENSTAAKIQNFDKVLTHGNVSAIARAAADFDEIFNDLRTRAKSGDIIITMGAGDINDLASRLVSR